MFLLEDTVVVSASDITQAGTCEFAFLRRFDEKLGRQVTVPNREDAMLERAARLGDVHEEAQLQRYRDRFGAAGVHEIDRPAEFTRAGIEERAAETAAALSSDADVIFQATFFEPALREPEREGEPRVAFIGFADFLRRTRDTEDGSGLGDAPIWQVEDTKLARTARVPALLQLAAYGEQIERLGFAAADTGALLLGDGARSEHRLSDIAPVYRSRRQRLITIILEGWARGDRIVEWGTPGVLSCGSCEVCEPEVKRTRDTLLVAGMRLGARQRLRDTGVCTIDELASLSPGSAVEGMGRQVVERYIAQARAQIAAEGSAVPAVSVRAPGALAAIPKPSEGDLFFDFEGDPMYFEPGADGRRQWGLDYLFGMIDVDEQFTALWAHTLEDERVALERFLAIVTKQRQRYPEMHVYHYASYERTHLLSIAARHGTGEAELDALLRDGVLIDLFPIVRQALTIGSRSYSIKKLEPLYMGAELRNEDGVTDAAQSVIEYAHAAQLLSATEASERSAGEAMLDNIADYNRYDCVSTLRLRDWLLGIAAEHGVSSAIAPVPGTAEDARDEVVSALGSTLMSLAERQEQQPDAQALRIAASAIDYHQREQKSFWWAHFARLVDPVEDWADTRDVCVVDAERSRVIETWHTPPRARKPRREIELSGVFAPGSSVKEGQTVFAIYEAPAPFLEPNQPSTQRGARQVTVISRENDRVLVRETLPDDSAEWQTFPIALTPGPPPHAGAQKASIEHWGEMLVSAVTAGDEPRDPVFDLLRRRPPRFVSGDAPASEHDTRALDLVDGDAEQSMIGAVLASLLDLDDSYLAVQGPPGTGKTYLASRVIKKLVEAYGWRIGVVAQSHSVVENVLDGVVSAGLDENLVAKVPQGGKPAPETEAPAWRVLPANGHRAFLDETAERGVGAVIGGTAWDFSHEGRFDERTLDLLVIDEAGQFSLAPTIASSRASRNLLLLGDPQQLPQVSQGSHPEPVDESALGWLIGDNDTLPEELGYFLAVTRRMHPDLTLVDSQLAYGGKLRAHPSTAQRIVRGVGPAGLTWHPVSHQGNSTFSREEAEVVAELITEMLGATIQTGETAETRPLTESDFIVVAAYNAQVECVSEVLAAHGIHGVAVGTVDKFQGQEAAVALVTLAASSPQEVPRGLEFLLMRNRLNVAISRAQWAAHMVSSPGLSGVGLPVSIAELNALSGYLSLIEHSHEPETQGKG